MKRIALLMIAAMAMLTLQNCKKSSTDDTVATTATIYALQANVNGVVWVPDTLNANITYNAAKKTKTFNFTGTYLQKRLTCSVTINNADNTNNFPLGTNIIDSTVNPSMIYSTYQKDVTGAYAFVPVATAGNGEGNVAISAIDPVKGLISGSFNFTTKNATYDNNGNIVSVTNTVVSAGYLTNMAYTFVSN